MFGKSVTLFRLFGFEVRVDVSWLILALLVVWTLARGYFPATHPGFAAETYWWMGVAGAVGLLVSIVLHELSHALVARRYDLPIRGITLFIFGGVAQMEDEPPNAEAELMMAIAGPIASLLIALAAYGGALAARAGGLPAPVVTGLAWLAMINFVLALFNLVPAFPLDGGRVLRALLWRWKQDLRRATRTAARVGEGFGIALIALGALAVLTGNVLTGVWWVLIGMFLRSAARSSYYQVLVRRALEGEPVRRFMTTTPITVEPGTSVRQLVEDFIYQYHHDMFPVASDGLLQGCVGIAQVKQVPKLDWDRKTVGEIAVPRTPQNTVSPDLDAVHALAQMRREGSSRLLVAEDGRLVGIVALKDLLGFLSAKLDLEGVS